MPAVVKRSIVYAVEGGQVVARELGAIGNAAGVTEQQIVQAAANGNRALSSLGSGATAAASASRAAMDAMIQRFQDFATQSQQSGAAAAGGFKAADAAAQGLYGNLAKLLQIQGQAATINQQAAAAQRGLFGNLGEIAGQQAATGGAPTPRVQQAAGVQAAVQATNALTEAEQREAAAAAASAAIRARLVAAFGEQGNAEEKAAVFSERLRLAYEPEYALAQQRARISAAVAAGMLSESTAAKALANAEAEAARASTSIARNTRFAVLNVSEQFQDFIVQVEGGTSALKAFSQQGPQAIEAIAIAAGGLPLPISLAIAGIATLAALSPALLSLVGAHEDAAKGAADQQKETEALFKSLGVSTKSTDDFSASIANLSAHQRDLVAVNLAAEVQAQQKALEDAVKSADSLVNRRIGSAVGAAETAAGTAGAAGFGMPDFSDAEAIAKAGEDLKKAFADFDAGKIGVDQLKNAIVGLGQVEGMTEEETRKFQQQLLDAASAKEIARHAAELYTAQLHLMLEELGQHGVFTQHDQDVLNAADAYDRAKAAASSYADTLVHLREQARDVGLSREDQAVAAAERAAGIANLAPADQAEAKTAVDIAARDAFRAQQAADNTKRLSDADAELAARQRELAAGSDKVAEATTRAEDAMRKQLTVDGQLIPGAEKRIALAGKEAAAAERQRQAQSATKRGPDLGAAAESAGEDIAAQLEREAEQRARLRDQILGEAGAYERLKVTLGQVDQAAEKLAGTEQAVTDRQVIDAKRKLIDDYYDHLAQREQEDEQRQLAAAHRVNDAERKLADQLEERRLNETVGGGLDSALTEMIQHGEEVGKSLKENILTAYDQINDAAIEWINGQKSGLESMRQALLSFAIGLEKIALEYAESELFKGILGLASGAAGTFSTVLSTASAVAATGHEGAVIGESGGSKMVDPAVFFGAPRMHYGAMLGPDERAFIGLTGERVLNRQETAAYDSRQPAPPSIVYSPTFHLYGYADPTIIRQAVEGASRQGEARLRRSLAANPRERRSISSH